MSRNTFANKHVFVSVDNLYIVYRCNVDTEILFRVNLLLLLLMNNYPCMYYFAKCYKLYLLETAFIIRK